MKGGFIYLLLLNSLFLINFTDCRASYGQLSHVSDDNPLLILISFDGFRWDYLENHTLPNFQRFFVKEGVKVSGGLLNAFTTVTVPNHWTLATGLYPESHGKPYIFTKHMLEFEQY